MPRFPVGSFPIFVHHQYMTMMADTIHQGRNIKRFREMLRLKQEALAIELGEDWNQKKVSLLESKETVDDKLLEQVAKVPKEAIERLTEEGAVQIIASTFTNNDNSAFCNSVNYNPSLNSMDKYIEAVEKIEKLYEQLLKVEREKNELLQKLIAR